MTYREYKPKWLNDDVFVDIYGREYNLSDVPMTYMKRREAFEKRGYSDEQIDEIYEKWIEEQIELNNEE
jgi:SOS response regulatory protein OraA/RecX